MPPPTQNPCRVCACWAKAEVASRAVRSAQNPVARSVPMSPLVLERVCRGVRRRAFAWPRGAVGKLQTNLADDGKLLPSNVERWLCGKTGGQPSSRFAPAVAAYGSKSETGAAEAAPVRTTRPETV